jgi:hypothetical protein
MSQRVGGIIQFAVDQTLYRCAGAFSYNLGRPKREAKVGVDTVHGYNEKVQAAFVEGEITDGPDLDLDALVTATGVTVTLSLANGKVIALGNAWFAGEGTGTTEEGNIAVRFEASDRDATEIQ